MSDDSLCSVLSIAVQDFGEILQNQVIGRLDPECVVLGPRISSRIAQASRHETAGPHHHGRVRDWIVEQHVGSNLLVKQRRGPDQLELPPKTSIAVPQTSTCGRSPEMRELAFETVRRAHVVGIHSGNQLGLDLLQTAIESVLETPIALVRNDSKTGIVKAQQDLARPVCPNRRRAQSARSRPESGGARCAPPLHVGRCVEDRHQNGDDWLQVVQSSMNWRVRHTRSARGGTSATNRARVMEPAKRLDSRSLQQQSDSLASLAHANRGNSRGREPVGQGPRTLCQLLLVHFEHTPRAFEDLSRGAFGPIGGRPDSDVHQRLCNRGDRLATRSKIRQHSERKLGLVAALKPFGETPDSEILRSWSRQMSRREKRQRNRKRAGPRLSGS